MKLNLDQNFNNLHYIFYQNILIFGYNNDKIAILKKNHNYYINLIKKNIILY